jgi:hypothetical protein
MKRILALLLAALGLALVAGCGAAPPPAHDGKVELFVTVHPDGSASADVFLNGMAATEADRASAAEQLGGLLFPNAAHTATVNGDGLRSSSIIVTATDFYEPGPSPEIALASKGAVDWLIKHGAASVAVFVSTPSVPATHTWAPSPVGTARGTTDDPWVWEPVTSIDAAPAGVAQLQPQPWKGLLTLLACLLAWGGLAVAVGAAVKRRWTLAIGGALVPVIALALVLGLPDVAGMLDNLGVSGQLAGAALEVARRLPGSLLLAALAGVGVIVLAANRRARVTQPPLDRALRA